MAETPPQVGRPYAALAQGGAVLLVPLQAVWLLVITRGDYPADRWDVAVGVAAVVSLVGWTVLGMWADKARTRPRTLVPVGVTAVLGVLAFGAGVFLAVAGTGATAVMVAAAAGVLTLLSLVVLIPGSVDR